MLRYPRSPRLRASRTESTSVVYKHGNLIFRQYVLGEEGSRSSLRVDRPGADIRVSREDSIRARFLALAGEWRAETKFMSSVADIVAHPAYLAIIAMGPSAVPLILEQMRQRPGHWFVALESITGHKPEIAEEDIGNMRKVTEAWLAYGQHQHP
jgi:hypothetical protein